MFDSISTFVILNLIIAIPVGVWLFGADGGPGGGLSIADRDRWLEVAVTLKITDALADVLDVCHIDGEHGATTEHLVAPQNLADLGPTRSAAAWN